MRQKSSYKLAVAIALVLAVAASLWFASPVKALTIGTTPPPDGFIGGTHNFTVVVTIEDTELIPIQNIDLYIYKSDDRPTYEGTCNDLPLGTTVTPYTTITPTGTSGTCGTVSITATAQDWVYGYGYGYAGWQGYGYYFFPPGGYGYGYGPGPASITYTGTWSSPSDWPAGDYEIEVKVTADGKTFTDISDTFNLRRRAVGGGGAGGARDTRPPEFSDIELCLDVAVTRTTADICWRTDEASDSQVEYRASPSMLSPLDTALVYYHHVQLSGLTPATTYYYRVMSRDFSDNLAVSDVNTFTTLGTPPTFTTSALSISPTEVDVGEEVTISVLVTNIGEAAGSYEVTLKVDDVGVDSVEVILAGGASEETTFTTTKDIAGTYTVDVNGLTGTFVVKEAPPPPPPPPPITPPKEINWWLLGGIVAAVVALIVNLVRVYRRRRA